MKTERQARQYLLAIFAMCLAVSGCGRTDAPQSAPVQQQGLNTPVSPLPERPAPDVAKGAVAEYPKAGQTNNHSSPDFKGGTAADQK